MAFEGLSDRLQNAMTSVSRKGKITEADLKQMMREVRLALLEADVNFKVVKDFVRKVNERALGANVLEALSPRNLVVMDMKSGSLTIALGATEYKRYPKDEKPTKDNTTIGVSWEHGIYLGSTLSTTNFKAYKREYGTPEKIEDIYDYRAKLKQKFYFYQDMSKDDDVPKKLQNDFLHQMYEDFGTIEEDCFYDRLEDGKYDKGFKERQVKEEKSR